MRPKKTKCKNCKHLLDKNMDYKTHMGNSFGEMCFVHADGHLCECLEPEMLEEMKGAKQ